MFVHCSYISTSSISLSKQPHKNVPSGGITPPTLNSDLRHADSYVATRLARQELTWLHTHGPAAVGAALLVSVAHVVPVAAVDADPERARRNVRTVARFLRTTWKRWGKWGRYVKTGRGRSGLEF